MERAVQVMVLFALVVITANTLIHMWEHYRLYRASPPQERL